MWICLSLVPRSCHRACCCFPPRPLRGGDRARARLPGTVDRYPRVLRRCRRAGRFAGAFSSPVLFALGAFMVVSGARLGYDWADSAFSAFSRSRSASRCSRSAGSIATVIELRNARAEVARLAMSDERLRISRDVHDILGHSLSVIALKAQVARRLMQTRPGCGRRGDRRRRDGRAGIACRGAGDGHRIPPALARRRIAGRARCARRSGDRLRRHARQRRASGACRQPARMDGARRRHQRAAPQPRASLRDLAVLE